MSSYWTPSERKSVFSQPVLERVCDMEGCNAVVINHMSRTVRFCKEHQADNRREKHNKARAKNRAKKKALAL